MDIIDLLLNPGAAIGCLIGIGIAAGLHWLFPKEDFALIQALVIVFCTAVGVYFQLKSDPRHHSHRSRK